MATLIVIDRLNTQPEEQTTVQQIAKTRKITTRTAMRHLMMLERAGYIRRESSSAIKGRPTTIHIIKEIPPEVLAKIPYEDMHEPKSQKSAFWWDLMGDIVHYGKPLTDLTDGVMHWLKSIGFTN